VEILVGKLLRQRDLDERKNGTEMKWIYVLMVSVSMTWRRANF
jgi:hypothetical protein